METLASQAAVLIRKELKETFNGVKFSVRSESYSMGNKVNISYDADIDKSEIRKITNKYKMGNFDGMTDSYDYSNRNENLPQVKFIFIN